MLLSKWRERRARRRSEQAEQARQIKDRAWSIFREVAEPVVSDGRAKLSYPLTRGLGKYAEDDEWIGIQPMREEAAAVAICCPNTTWIDFAVGEPFPVGAVYELDITDGWEQELRLCLEAVIDGRYMERVRKRRLGEGYEMIFKLPSEERRIDRLYLSGSGFDTPLGEHHFGPY